MKNCRQPGLTGTEKFEIGASILQALASRIGGQLGKNAVSKLSAEAIEKLGGLSKASKTYEANGKAAANILTGNVKWTARAPDLFTKIHTGTATRADYLEVADTTLSILTSIAVLGGSSVAAPWVLTAAGVASTAVFVYKQYEKYQLPTCDLSLS